MSIYGYSVYDTGYYWQGKFGATPTQNYYGLQLYSQLNVQPFVATPRDYETIMVTWTQPQGTWYQFRLVANRYGYPVDQNDGNVLIDSTTYPGSSYADQQVIPGTYHYYSIYMRVNNIQPYVWERCGFASCLAPVSNGMGARMFNLLPVYFREMLNGDLTTDAAGNQYLVQFLNAIGWGFDYLKTQYDVLYQHLNDPMFIPLDDLVNLATELGMPFQPELPAHLMRKALANWTHVSQQRGTSAGISEHITLLTGYPIDLQVGANKMLEQDQSGPVDPVPQTWSANIGYVLNEMVTYQNYIYKCILAGGLGNAPTGTTAANTWWTVVQNTTDPNNTLQNANTVGGVNTWQALYPALDAGGNSTIPAGTLVNTIGMPNPVGADNHHGAFSVFNKQATAQDIMLRSISQIASDRTAAGTNTNMAPDQQQAVKDGIPIPRINTQTNGWVSTTRYATNDIVLWNGVLYQALRASTGQTPPNPGTPLNANPYFETNITPWTAYGGATIAQSTAQAFQGTHSMLMTPNGSTANPGAQSDQFNVIPGATYVASTEVWISSAWATTLLYVVWLDPFGATISTSNITASVGATTWTQIQEPVTAPANAAKAFISVQLVGTPANTVLSYWDCTLMSCWGTPEWEVLSTDNRLRYMLSGYADGPVSQVQVVPFVEFYDEGGNMITSNGNARLFARTAVAGTAGIEPNLTFDSFAMGPGTFLNGRQTDTQDQVWTTQLGSWAVSGFNGGSAYPASAGVRSQATVTGLAGASGTPIWLGVTFGSSVPSGTDAGIIFRWVSTSSYWRAGMTGLYLVTGGTASLIGSYSTACSPGDRLSVQLNGNNITVYRNGTQVLTTSNATNATATIHGIAVEGTTV